MYSNIAGIVLNSVPVLPSSASLPELGRVFRIPAGLAGVLQELGGGLESTGEVAHCCCVGVVAESGCVAWQLMWGAYTSLSPWCSQHVVAVTNGGDGLDGW